MKLIVRGKNIEVTEALKIMPKGRSVRLTSILLMKPRLKRHFRWSAVCIR